LTRKGSSYWSRCIREFGGRDARDAYVIGLVTMLAHSATYMLTIAGLRTCERPTAWLGMKDSNSQMLPQIIPLKDRTDLRESSRILALETIRV
jgi:hypothetical protein